MESGALEGDNTAAPGHRGPPDCNIACRKRRAWAQSRDSLWQESEQECSDPQMSQQSQGNEDAQRPSEEPGQVPNKITSWLIECRTPLGASLDDQSASPSRGGLRNGCSFEDDLSLGAEANHLQSTNSKTESCFGLVAEQKRSQFKERGRSMNSTGSGKSSTVSSVSEVLEQSKEHPEEILLTLCVSELLDLYEEDPEEVLLNLGFGQEEPDLASKVPTRFFNSSSSARGIDIKVYLAAQMQRMELENPNYALTSRFRQIEVLTTVANEFFQLYSQVSGQPVQRISTREPGEEGEGGGNESSPPLKRTNSARNVAKLLKKTLTKHNLLAASTESYDTHTPNQHTQLNGHSPPDHTPDNGHTGPEQNNCSPDPDHQGDMVSPKHGRKKDNCPLATVTEETNGDGETDQLTDESPGKSSTGPAANGEQQPISTDLQLTNQRTVERTQVVKEEEEKNLASTLEILPPTLAPPQLAQLRTENADSFDMEEIQSNEDETLPPRISRANDLSRTVSQQSDSSGFAEEPSADSNSYLKVQESSDSCDSETTVTSHPSQDATTPLATDQLVFDLPDCREVEAGPGGAAEADGKSSSRKENERDGNLEQVPQYTLHQLPRNRPVGAQQEEISAKEQVESDDRTNSELESELESTHTTSASEQETPGTQNQTAIAPPTEQPTEGVGAEDEAKKGHAFLEDSGLVCPPAPSSPVLSALQRAKQIQLTGQGRDQQLGEVPKTLGRGRGRRGIPMQRSSSLPSSLLSPSRVVSSVRIQFGQGQASCTQPRYSFKYAPDSGGDNGEKEEEEEEVDGQEQDEEGQTKCLSTLLINPASSSGSNSKPTRLSTQAPIPPKPIPRYLMRSTCSLQSSSPPPDWSTGGRAHSWSTQSVPELTYSQRQPGHLEQNMNGKQNQQSWNPGQVMFPYPNPNPSTQYVNISPNVSPGLNPNPYPYTVNTQYPSPLQPYASLPNLHHHHSPSHHSSLTSLHHPTTAIISQHGSLTNLHEPSTSTSPHHVSVGNPHPGSPVMHHQGYSYPYSHQSPYHAAPHSSPFASPYLGYHGYTMSPHLAFPHPITQCPPLAPEHSLIPGLTPPAPGFFPGMATAFGPGHGLHPGPSPSAAPLPVPNQGPSSTEMQLRRVLHDIRGTVQSLNQNRADTPDAFSEHRATLPSHQSLAEFQQKRRSLNLFRSQMMDLEMSIIRQQTMVYKHLSPADRLEMEQLQSLRSAVREELQELEQQLEDRLLELTHHTRYRDLHSSVDSLSTASALRAMEPVSDLLREQLFLQSELSYDGNAPSTNPSSRSSSPVRGEGGDGEQRQGVYRASINITPVLPPRPNTRTEEEREEEAERDGGGVGVDRELPEENGAAGGGVRVGNLQQLLREIRESVAQEVRQEIYGELLAAVSPRRSPLPTRQHPL